MKKKPTALSPVYAPGSFGFHELLDRSWLVAELFSREVAMHPAASHPKLAKRIKRVEDELYDLYGKIGAMHL